MISCWRFPWTSRVGDVSPNLLSLQYQPSLRVPRRAPAPLLQYLASERSLCAPPPPTDAKKTPTPRRPRWTGSVLAALSRGSGPSRSALGGAGGRRSCPWSRGCPARRSSARLPRRPARPSRLGRAGRWGMCRLWADLAHPGKQEVGDGQAGREQPAKRERNFAEQNPRSFGFSSSVKKKSCIFFFGETKPNCQTFQLITSQKRSKLLPV